MAAKKGMTAIELGKIREEKLWADVQEKAGAYADAVNSGQPEKIVKAAKRLASTTLDEYNTEHCKNVYRAWDQTEMGAVKSAVYLRFVEHVKTVSYPVGDDGLVAPKFGDTLRKADLPLIAATLGNDRFADVHWFTKLQKLAFLHATKISRRINGDANFGYKISDIAQEFEFSDGRNFSDANFYQALQTVFDSILMVPDESGNNTIKIHLEEDDNGVPFCKEWAVITESVTKQGDRPGLVNIGSTSKFSELVCDCMYVLVNPDKEKFELAAI